MFNRCVLIINSGSSSIKYALYETQGSLTELFSGEIESTDQENLAHELIDRLEMQDGFASVKAIGHRIVHGMQHTKPEQITPALLDELRGISTFDPEHMPGAITLIEVFGKRYPALIQIACFDTSFHTSMPGVAQRLPLPRRFHTRGIQRYGFHGLSYAYLMEELNIVAGPERAQGKVILAHLGNGASLAAVKNGISETSSDIRELLKSEATDGRAAEAIELFCYQTKKWIGSFAAVLGGLGSLVFSGGIGENSAAVRSRICQGLQFLGIGLDETRNARNEPIISTDASAVTVRVIRTKEELIIAKLVCQVLNYNIK